MKYVNSIVSMHRNLYLLIYLQFIDLEYLIQWLFVHPWISVKHRAKRQVRQKLLSFHKGLYANADFSIYFKYSSSYLLSKADG